MRPGGAGEGQATGTPLPAHSSSSSLLKPQSGSYLADADDNLVTIIADNQDKVGEVYKLSGNVEIQFRDLTIRGDEISWNKSTGDVTATGHLSFDGGLHDEHIDASHGEFNVRSKTGKFYDVSGTTGVKFKGKNMTLTSSDPFTFTGKMVEKVSENRYIIHHGTVTSCRLPDPKWTFNAERVVVDVGDSAKIYNTTFRVKNVPVLFLPFAAHPVANLGRQSGFLIPTFGASSRKGTIIGESFYWAINRSMDATVGAEYYSSRGWAQHGEFRSKPSQKSSLDVNYFGVLDRGYGPLKIKQGGQDIKLNAEIDLPAGVRGVAAVNYLSSFVFRLAFTETFSQAVNSEVKSLVFFTKNLNGFSFNTLAARYQNFQSDTRGDVITILRVPSVEISSVDRRFLKTPFFYGFTGAAEGVSRREPGFRTNDLVGRFDVHPRASLPLFLRGWTLRPEIGMRNTFYTQRKSASAGVGTPLDKGLNRRALDVEMEVRPPTLGRIFEKPFFGRTVKHTIEPRITYRLVSGVSGFSNIIRFDDRDILSDTKEFEFSLVQRLFLKKAASDACKDKLASEECQASPREFITWEVAQQYYLDDTFGGAIVNGKRNMVTSSAAFTGIAFLTEPRRFSPTISKLRMRATNNADISWQIDYDSKQGRISSSTVFVNQRIRDFFLGGSHAFLRSPGEIFVLTPMPSPDRFNQFRVLAGYGGPNKRGLSSAASIGLDAHREFLQYGSLQSSYNWDCCGLSMEYRRFALGTVRNENQFRFAFTLANVGTFGNMKRQERLF
ncbi:MAG TPA: LPS assembly protein LptD [Terriglobales bacterium]|nr:LPS assembly protein LptD [Terriglobales bacterium]